MRIVAKRTSSDACFTKSPSVENADERRVEPVKQKHRADRDERRSDVRRVLEARDRIRRSGERDAARKSDRHVNLRERTLCFAFAARCAGDRARRALRRSRNDDVVHDVCGSEHERERAIPVAPDESRKERLLDEPGQNEKYFREEHRDAADSRARRDRLARVFLRRHARCISTALVSSCPRL